MTIHIRNPLMRTSLTTRSPKVSSLRSIRSLSLLALIFYAAFLTIHHGELHIPFQSAVQIDSSYLDHLRSLPALPKKVHIFFPDKFYYRTNKDIPFVQHSIVALKKLNPDWNVTVYDDGDVDGLIRSAARRGLISNRERDILVGVARADGKVGKKPAHIVERWDIARLILMYVEGGFYMDANRLVNIPMSEVLSKNTRLCLPTYWDYNFCQDLMCSSPGNDLFSDMIRDCTKIRMKGGPGGKPQERREGWCRGGVMYKMGPEVYNRNILTAVFEGVSYEKINERGHRKAREALAQSDGLIVTKHEGECDDGLLVNQSIGDCYDGDRDELYEKYGLEPWAAEVDALWEDDK